MIQKFTIVKLAKEIDDLRTDLHNLVLWSKEWLMLFNIDKCNVMHFGHNNPNVVEMFTVWKACSYWVSLIKWN